VSSSTITTDAGGEGGAGGGNEGTAGASGLAVGLPFNALYLSPIDAIAPEITASRRAKAAVAVAVLPPSALPAPPAAAMIMRFGLVAPKAGDAAADALADTLPASPVLCRAGELGAVESAVAVFNIVEVVVV
jgi:hypothetical protein